MHSEPLYVSIHMPTTAASMAQSIGRLLCIYVYIYTIQEPTTKRPKEDEVRKDQANEER